MQNAILKSAIVILACTSSFAQAELEKLNCDDPALLRECIDRIAEARATISGFRVAYLWTQSASPIVSELGEDGERLAKIVASGTTTLTGLGDMRLKSTTQQVANADGSEIRSEVKTVIRTKNRIILGVQFDGQDGTLQECEFNNIEAASDRVQMIDQANLAGDILLYGFGDGESTLDKHLKLHTDVNRWSAQRQPDGTVRIARYSPIIPGNSVPDCEWHVDPAKGWLIVKVINRDSDQTVLSTMSIDVEKQASGTWFPTGYTRDDSGGITQVHLTNIEINPELTASDFDWPAFGVLMEGYRGFRESAVGDLTNFLVQDGLPVEKQTSELFRKN